MRSSSGLTFSAVLLLAAAVLQKSFCKSQKSQGVGTGQANSRLWSGRTAKSCTLPLPYADTLLTRENRLCNHSVACKSLQLLCMQSHFMTSSSDSI